MKKFVIIVSILGLVLLAAAELYVQSDSFALRIRPLVVDRLKSVLGKEAEIGWVRANLIPAYLEARDISLADDRGVQVVAIRKIRIYVNPLPLLLKRIRLPSIVLLEPRIYAARTKEGELNLAPIVERIKSNIGRLQTEGTSGFSFHLHTVTVNKGRISLKDGLTAAQVTVSGLQVSAAVNLSGDSVKVAIKNSEIYAAAPAFGELSGGFRAAVWYDHGRYHLDSFQLTTADAMIFLTGDIGSLPDVPLNLRLKIKSGPQTLGRFSYLKALKKEQSSRIEASVLVKGTVADPAVEGTLRFSGIAYAGMQLKDAALTFGYSNKSLTLAGEKWKLGRGNESVIIDSIDAALGYSYSDRGLDIKRFAIAAGDFSLHIAGRADPQQGFDAVLTAESVGRGQTLSFLTTVPLGGRVVVKGYLTGTFGAPLFDGTVSAGPLAVRGILFDTVDGRLQYREKKVSIVSADIHQGASRYLFEGTMDLAAQSPFFTARAKFIRSDVVSIVALFYKPIPLQVSATGELSFGGTAQDFTGSGRLTLEPGSAYGESFTRATVSAELSRDRIAFPDVKVNKGSGVVKGTGWIGFDGNYSATITSSNVKLSEVDHLTGLSVDGRCDLKIESSGSFSRPKASASLDVDELFYNQTALGGLSAELLISDGVLTFKSSLVDERASVSAHLSLSKPYAWSLRAAIKSDSLDPFLAFGKKDFPGRVRLSAEGDLSVRGNGADISTFTGAASFSRLSLMIGDYRIENTSEASIAIQAARLSFASLNFGGPGTRIVITGGATLFKDMDLSCTGTANLSLLRLMFREVEHADGTAEVKLTMRDEWKNPEMNGELRIKKGEVKIKDIPQKFSALNGTLTFDRSRIVVDSLNAETGGGTLSASGWAQLTGFALRDFSTKATFDNVTVRYPAGLTSTLSGDLYYDGNAAEQSLTGDVTIKRARYDKRVEWKSMLVDIGKGLYQKKKTEVGWIGDTQINVRFHGKDNILLQNNLAKMPLDVDMFLRGTVNQPQLLGRVEAQKGKVYFRKNEFNILHASADFVDPNRMNPVLDIQAEIQVRGQDREYRIRLAVAGTADRAVVTLLSDPSLPDSDILTLLALGKTGTELKGRETGVGMSEAYSFATGQLQDIVESRARTLTGLDRFQVDPYVSKGDTSVPRVTVGKELVQDKLYVTYSSNVGSTTQEQVFRIEYILNRHFSLVGERNEIGNTGADIKYRFEFK